MKWHKESQVTIPDGRMFHKGIVAEKRKIYRCSYEKKLNEIYTCEIHGFVEMYKVEWDCWDCCWDCWDCWDWDWGPLGLLLDHYKIEIIEI